MLLWPLLIAGQVSAIQTSDGDVFDAHVTRRGLSVVIVSYLKWRIVGRIASGNRGL